MAWPSPFSSREGHARPCPCWRNFPSCPEPAPHLSDSVAQDSGTKLTLQKPCKSHRYFRSSGSPVGCQSCCSRPSARNVPFPGMLSVPVSLAGCTAVSSRPRSLPGRGLDPRPPTLPSNRFRHAHAVGTPEKQAEVAAIPNEANSGGAGNLASEQSPLSTWAAELGHRGHTSALRPVPASVPAFLLGPTAPSREPPAFEGGVVRTGCSARSLRTTSPRLRAVAGAAGRSHPGGCASRGGAPVASV